MKILVADDDIVSRTMVVMILQKSGMEVVACENGEIALQKLLEPDAPRLAILDWMMPKLDGPDVIRAVREQAVTYPYLILLSNRSETADKVAGLESGADDYLSKPVSATELKARIQVGQRFLKLQDQLDAKSKALIQLERQQKISSLNQMAGGVAHHLNNKLQAVIGFLDLMLMEHPHRNDPDCDEIDLLTQTRSAAEEATDIGKKMLSYLSQNRGQPEPVDLNTAVEAVIDELLKEYPVLKEAEPVLSPDRLRAYANPAEMHEVILQILRNALEANPLHPPSISIESVNSLDCMDVPPHIPQISSCDELPDTESYIQLSVQDNGPGIPADQITRIFDPFMSTKFTGRGMGLPVCLGIIKKIGGGIRISSPKTGGTRVVVCLPQKNDA